jgi:hypothetical protein
VPEPALGGRAPAGVLRRGGGAVSCVGAETRHGACRWM